MLKFNIRIRRCTQSLSLRLVSSGGDDKVWPNSEILFETQFRWVFEMLQKVLLFSTKQRYFLYTDAVKKSALIMFLKVGVYSL